MAGSRRQPLLTQPLLLHARPLALLVLVAAVSAPAARAQEAPALKFGVERLDVSCDELKGPGKRLLVVNTTAKEQTLNLLISRTEPGGDIRAACGGLGFACHRAKVPAADSVIVTLKLRPQPAQGQKKNKEKAKPDKKPRKRTAPGVKQVVSGALVVYGDSGVASRIPVTVGPATDAGAAMPLVDAVSATDYRHQWHGEKASIWIPVDLGDKKTSSLKPGRVVGAVSGDDDRAAVTYVETKTVDGVPRVGLRVGHLAADEYKGSVDLLPDDDKGDVSLAVTVKDWWLLPLLVLAGGFAVAFLVQRMTGIWIPRFTLRSKASGIAQTYTTARQRLIDAPGAGAWKQSTLSDMPETAEQLKTEINAKFKGAYVSVDQKVTDALQAAVDAADKLVARFGELADVLPVLNADLERLKTRRPADLPPLEDVDESPDQPVLATQAGDHLTKKELPLAALVPELNAVAISHAAIGGLIGLDHYMASLYRDALSLKHRYQDPLDQPKLDQVEEAIGALRGIRRQGWLTDEPGRPAELFVRLRDVDNQLSLLWPDPAARAAVHEGLLPRQVDFAEAIAGRAYVGAPREITIADEVEQAREQAALARWLQLLALAVGLLLAFVAGMGALYIGKPFGTTWDYITIVTWGLATPTALTVAAAALNNLGALTALGQRLRG